MYYTEASIANNYCRKLAHYSHSTTTAHSTAHQPITRQEELVYSRPIMVLRHLALSRLQVKRGEMKILCKLNKGIKAKGCAGTAHLLMGKDNTNGSVRKQKIIKKLLQNVCVLQRCSLADCK